MAVDLNEIVQRLESNEDVDPLEALLVDVQTQDPRMRVIRALIERRRKRARDGGDADDAPSLARGATIDATRLGQAVSDACSELTQLRQRCQELAAALGACPNCWGEDARCGTCRGKGTPGTVAPELARFRELVAPAVARLARAPEAEPLRPRDSQANDAAARTEGEPAVDLDEKQRNERSRS